MFEYVYVLLCDFLSMDVKVFMFEFFVFVKPSTRLLACWACLKRSGIFNFILEILFVQHLLGAPLCQDSRSVFRIILKQIAACRRLF